MGPVRKTDGASSSSGAETTKPYTRRPQDERCRKRLRVERDSDDDVQIIEDEDTGLPSGRTGQKSSNKESAACKEPETSGKSGWFKSSSTSNKSKAEHKGKGKGLKNESTSAAEEAGPSTTMVDYYKVLEIQRSATTTDIKKSYRRLALKWHPDKNPDNQEEATSRFRELSEAYEVLIDEKKRKIYDQYGKEGLLNSGRPASGHHRSRCDHGANFGGFDSFGFGSPFDFGFGFTGFAFRDPEEVFKEFFRGDPMADLMDDFFGNDPFFGGSRNRSNNNNRAQRPSVSGGLSRQPNNSLASPFFSPMGFGLGGPMGLSNFFGMHDSMGTGGGGSEFFSTTTFGVGAGGQPVPAVKRTSTSTRVSNGKKIVTKKVVENGVETVTVSENGVLKSKTINGVSQAIAY
ncbi:putative DnaJ subfamily B member 6 [Daphnia magna]|uniref:DnaJ subfamily B member n=2 Tax=Daphnia magna TaxID=35525 RepID=A0A0P5FLP5_9CRUS|nr:putative DnaJ subfamily B member 6 [Daphnia magna]